MPSFQRLVLLYFILLGFSDGVSSLGNDLDSAVEEAAIKADTPTLRGTGQSSRSLVTVNTFGFTTQIPDNCTDDILEVLVRTNGNPGDNFWYLKTNGEKIAQGGNYQYSYKKYFSYICLPPGSYRFTIEDVPYVGPGNGMCSGTISGCGYYNVTLNGCRSIKNGSVFQHSQSKGFNVHGGDCAPSASPSPSMSPSMSNVPSVAPSSAPSQDCNIYEDSEYYIERAQSDEDEYFGIRRFLGMQDQDNDYALTQSLSETGFVPTDDKFKFRLTKRSDNCGGGAPCYYIESVKEENELMTWNPGHEPPLVGTGSVGNDALWKFKSTNACRTFKLRSLQDSDMYIHGTSNQDITLKNKVEGASAVQQKWIFTPAV